MAQFLGSRMPEPDARTHLGAHWRLLPTAANRQPAFGLYLQSVSTGSYERFGIGVLTVGADGVKEMAVFMENPGLFDLFDLPLAG